MSKHLRLGAAVSVAIVVGVVAATAHGGGGKRHLLPLENPAYAPKATSFYANPPAVRVSTPAVGGVGACGTPDGSLLISCFGPQDMREIYDIPDPATTKLDGSGQTIVLVDAYGSPTIRDDLKAFDDLFGLPHAPFTIYEPYPITPGASQDELDGWASETTVDVEWAHAIAPKAKIVLVVTPSADNRVMTRVEAMALPRYPNSIVSHQLRRRRDTRPRRDHRHDRAPRGLRARQRAGRHDGGRRG